MVSKEVIRMKKKSIPGAVLGIIGAVFAIIGGLGLALCAEVVSASSNGAVDYTWAAYVLGLGGGIVGLIGAILDFSKPKVGGVLQLIAAVMGIVICILMYWQWAMIIAFILFAVGGILSFCVQKDAA